MFFLVIAQSAGESNVRKSRLAPDSKQVHSVVKLEELNTGARDAEQCTTLGNLHDTEHQYAHDGKTEVSFGGPEANEHDRRSYAYQAEGHGCRRVVVAARVESRHPANVESQLSKVAQGPQGQGSTTQHGAT